LSNLNTIGRIEDISFGLEANLQLGRASAALGTDRRAWIVSGSARKGWQLSERSFLFVDGSANTRWEADGVENGTLYAGARYFLRNLERHLFSIGFATVLSDRLDADRQLVLGGETGLRGYPLRYQTGRRSAVVSLEERLFTDLYPWHLFRVAGAVFLDGGRVWGRDPRATPSRGMLYDVGVGIRLASPRSSRGSVVHVDLAFPINGDPDIDGAQLSVETKGTF
jgi:hemolysin activation/secretion protein